ncbi:winged helix-turn-helix transcriptional regulator [Streptomyces sp. NPDC057433]|uniref:winged helix-turn-helix transcriptional regulator n=1 Tax=Streptomyces sp. NPDC057433 TaxID=3346132 RepID=UPI0036AA80A1
MRGAHPARAADPVRAAHPVTSGAGGGSGRGDGHGDGTAAGACPCGTDAATDVAGGKGKALILRAPHERPHRFGAPRRELSGITEKVLASHLREPESDAIVHRGEHDGTPPRVESSLTPGGHGARRGAGTAGHGGRAHVPQPLRGSAAAGEVGVDDDVAPVAGGA